MQNERFDAIPIPEELDSAVKAGIQEGIRQQRRLYRKQIILRYGTIAAAALIVICAGVLLVSDPSLAAKLPFVGRIFSTVQEEISYKGNFSDSAEVYVEGDVTGSQNKNVTQTSEEGGAGISEFKSKENTGKKEEKIAKSV